MSKLYCNDIHAGLVINPGQTDIALRPCCLVGTEERFAIGSDFKFTELFNEMRVSNKKDLLIAKGCKYCTNLESYSPGSSKRTDANIMFPGTNIDSVGPNYIELSLDFTCNLACLICSPNLSSTWTKYSDQEPSAKITNKFSVVEDIFDKLDLSRLRKIHILGGEPFMSAQNIVLLRYLRDTLDASKVIIMYHTNGSILPAQEVLDLLSEFKMVEIYFSIDGLNEAHEYQRFPIKWNELEYNLEKFSEMSPHNTLFKIEFTMGLLNVHLYNEFKKWYETCAVRTNRFGDDSYLVTHLVAGRLALTNISEQHASWLEKNYPETAQYIGTTRGKNSADIVEFILDQDTRRNNDINRWFPEFITFYR